LDAFEDTVLGLNNPKLPNFLTSNKDVLVYTTYEAISGLICEVLVS
jgi:hypothetical protein